VNDERDKMAATEKEIFEEARDRLKIASDAESDNRLQAKADLLFREGQQWDSNPVTSASQESPEMTINFTDALVTRVVNNLRQQRPRGKAHPVGSGADVDIAEVINGIGRHIEYRSEAGIAYDTAGDHATTMGWGYWRMISEYVAPDSFDQDIRILPIFRPFAVYLDPDAMMPTGQDANWCIISVKMKRTEFKRRYPRQELNSWSDIGQPEHGDDWEDKESIRLAEYFRIRETSERLFLIRDQNGGEDTRWARDKEEAEVLRAAGVNVVAERMSMRRTVEWYRLNGTKVVDRKKLPGSYIPVIRCQGNARDIDGKVYRRGMVRSMQDPQKMVNYGEVAKIRRLGLTPQAPWVAAEGQLDGNPEWSSANNVPYAALIYKPITIMTGQGEVLLPPPQRQPPAQLEQGFAEFTQGMRSNLLAVAGMPNEPGQDERGQVVSGKAITKRQGLSDQSHFQYFDNQTLAIAHTWRIMLEWIPHYYSEERMQRIIGEDGQPKMVKINERTVESGVQKVKNDLTIGRYDVVMDTGPGYDTKREEGAENLINLLGVAPLAELIAKVGADLVFRSIDHPYMQEMADRISAMNPEGMQQVLETLPDRAKAIVQSLARQLQQAQQALQAAQLEIKYGMQKELLKQTTKAHDTETHAETMRYDTEVRAHTELARAEISGATQLLNTHVEAAHERRAAERMIEQGLKEEATDGNSANSRT